MSRCRNWCFTLNNPTNADIGFWQDLDDWVYKDSVKYVVLQEEEGENGTRHLQGYIELTKQLRMSRMRTLFGRRYHWEVRRGSQAQAIAYSKKLDTRVDGGLVIEWGNAKRGGGKWGAAVAALKGGMGIEELSDEFAEQYVLYKDKLHDYALELKGKRDWAMEIEIYVGPSGAGKSYTAAHKNIGAYSAPWPTGGRWWWPGYTGQEVVVMDEFRHQIKMDVMLKMMDRYEWHLEAKGRNFQFCSKKIIITTNIDPKDWYPGVAKDVKEPLARRIREFAHIFDFGEHYVFPQFSMMLRTERFEFNDSPVRGFGAGNADYD